MFGGNQDKEPVIEAYRMWARDYGEQSARERFETSARRLLLNSFRVGLFENPYLDPEEADRIVGNPNVGKSTLSPYHDSEGNTYEFAFGLNWSGVIDDQRTARYK